MINVENFTVKRGFIIFILKKELKTEMNVHVLLLINKKR